MDRLQPIPPTTTEEGTASVPSLPAVERRPVRELLASLRAPGVTAEEVDVFLASLEASYLPGESPRERADLMLDTLEEERLCELRGSDGGRVGLAALETLLRLGHPYVFDLTPEMLARARGAAPPRWPPRVLMGLGLTGVNVLLTVVLFAHQYLHYVACEAMNCWADEPETAKSLSLLGRNLPLVVLMLLVPPVLARLARNRTSKAVQEFLSAVQVMVGLVGLFIAFFGGWDFWREMDPPVTFIPGVLSLLTAWCLLPRENPSPEADGS